ncbi:MAG: hypothetical protein ABSG80_12270 [Verrucomicrobiota bacterium]|jgi:hypothetical protein
MQTQWYGDKRDVVKWATLIHLCKEQGLRIIVQVPFLNDAEFSHELRIDRQPRLFPKSVWSHFRDLKHIEELGGYENLDIQIIDGQFKHAEREAYINKVCETIDRYTEFPKAVFLDPDTGIAPQKPDARHVVIEEIKTVWRRLKRGDWLVLYQHALRTKNWRSVQGKKFARACGGVTVRAYDCGTIAHDVVFFCAEQKS